MNPAAAVAPITASQASQEPIDVVALNSAPTPAIHNGNALVQGDQNPAPSSMDDHLAAVQPSFEWLATSGGGFPSIWDPSFLSADSTFNIDDDGGMAMEFDWNALIQPEQYDQSYSDLNETPAQGGGDTGAPKVSRPRGLSGLEVFKKSVWLWDPDPSDSASNEEAPQLSEAEERRILSPAPAVTTTTASRTGIYLLDQAICRTDDRDAVLLLVQQNSEQAVVIRSFPSSKILDFLLKNFLAHEGLGVSSFIHIPSLNESKCCVELLSAMIVGGSVKSANAHAWKFGMTLQERTRLALYKALDQNNRVARNLHIIQAQLLWIETGLWSGNRRKMEVAESAANNVPTVGASPQAVF